MSNHYRTLIKSSPVPPIIGVPRLIPSRSWGSGNQTVLLEITPSVGDNGKHYLAMRHANGKLFEIKNSGGNIEFLQGGIVRGSWVPYGVKTRILVSFSKSTSTLISIYKNNSFFTAFSSTGTAIQHNFSGDVGVCADSSGNNQSYNAATIFKILSGLYTNFDTANAVTGAGLIFDGTNF